mmetsp:Transcript_38269/g.50431  ORF Transcript_38269/g.50431 Transcript_38269/m.50431 type:complete len:431 (-) Transcript_38269:229-1521(-)
MASKKGAGSKSTDQLKKNATNQDKFTIFDRWSAVENEKNDIDMTQKPVTSFKPSGQFRRDFLKLCEIVQLIPHPAVVPHRPPPDLKQDESLASLNSTMSKGSKKKTRGSLKGGKGKAAALEEIFDLTESDILSMRNSLVDTRTLQVALHLVAIPDHCNVTKIDFYNAGLTHSQLCALAEALPSTQISQLHVDFNPISEDAGQEEDMEEKRGTKIFAELVGEESPVRIVSLRGNHIKDAGAQAIALSIVKNTRCTSLNLFDNDISDIGGTAIADALKVNPLLNSVSLANNRLTSSTLLALGELLTRYELTPMISEMRTEANNRIGLFNKHVAEIRKKLKDPNAPGPQPLPDLPDIEEVEGVQYVKGSSTLLVLNLGANLFDDDAAQALFRLLIPHKIQLTNTFRAMSLAGNKISSHVSEMFQEFSPIQFWF